MLLRVCRFLLVGWVLGFVALSKDEAPPTAPEPTLKSLQAEVEELKEGQRQLIEQVEALQKELAGRPPIVPVEPEVHPPPVITQRILGEPFRGSESARVAIIEYSDFNCSYCAKYATNIFPLLDKEFIQTGKIRYLFRDFPDAQDPDSLVKSQVARCVAEQGKFWEMHDRFFRESLPVLDHPEVLVDHARALGFDAVQVNLCVKSGHNRSAIEQLAKAAKRFGVHGTPSFLIGRLSDDGNVLYGTRLMTGAETYESLQTVLKEFF